MSDNKQLIPKDSAALALSKTQSLLRITDKILARKTSAIQEIPDNSWVDELISWAKKNRILKNLSP